MKTVIRRYRDIFKHRTEWWLPFFRIDYWISYFKTNKVLAELSRSKDVQDNTKAHQPFNKTIWLLWFQGWQDAPWLVKQAARSWEIQNPGWDIKYLSSENLATYLSCAYWNRDDISFQAKSDIIRLYLLQEHGGVWADATLFCMQPLDNWVWNLIQPSGFWMYHGNGAQMNILEGPCSWFMVSRRDSVLIRKWKDACDQFWNAKTDGRNVDYFWMDQLFKKLWRCDEEFEKQWRMVPYVSCELYGGSHCLQYHFNLAGSSKFLKSAFIKKPPFVIKLWWQRWMKSFPDIDHSKCIDSNAMFAIQCATRGETENHRAHAKHAKSKDSD